MIRTLETGGQRQILCGKGWHYIIAQHGRVISHTRQGKQTWSAKKAIIATSSKDKIHIYAKKKITLNGGKTGCPAMAY